MRDSRRTAPRTLFLLSLLAAAAAFAGEAPGIPGSGQDRAVIAAAVADFVAWKEAGYGNPEGDLALQPESDGNAEQSAGTVLGYAPDIRARIPPVLAAAYASRNRSRASIRSLLDGLRGSRLYMPGKDAFPWERPNGTKAVGTIGLPGYSVDGMQALLQLRHSWSIHDAVTTYLLERTGGKWHVVARDQVVFP